MQKKIETDIANIEKCSQLREAENWDFRCFLKGSDLSVSKIDSIVKEIYREVSAQIDCTQCANCCKVIQPILKQADIAILAGHLKLSVTEIKSRFLTEDGDGQGFVFKTRPCPFLADNHCTVYEHRPQDCRSYPHLHKKDFVFRVNQAFSNCSVCPIVFNVYEGLKQTLRPRKSYMKLEQQ
ncbi:MAG: YkgJ family cysteine cluster protein [Desulfuromonadaceae bacterium]